MWRVQGELWCGDADHEVSEVYCQFQHVLLAPTNTWYVKTWYVKTWYVKTWYVKTWAVGTWVDT